jgi:hypothetical protein
LFGTVHWVTDPSPWADRYRSRFVASPGRTRDEAV